jgi:hypothetical protein
MANNKPSKDMKDFSPEKLEELRKIVRKLNKDVEDRRKKWVHFLLEESEDFLQNEPLFHKWEKAVQEKNKDDIWKYTKEFIEKKERIQPLLYLEDLSPEDLQKPAIVKLQVIVQFYNIIRLWAWTESACCIRDSERTNYLIQTKGYNTDSWSDDWVLRRIAEFKKNTFQVLDSFYEDSFNGKRYKELCVGFMDFEDFEKFLKKNNLVYGKLDLINPQYHNYWDFGHSDCNCWEGGMIDPSEFFN